MVGLGLFWTFYSIILAQKINNIQIQQENGSMGGLSQFVLLEEVGIRTGGGACTRGSGLLRGEDNQNGQQTQFSESADRSEGIFYIC